MSEFDSKPLVLFKTLTNTELGAERVRIEDEESRLMDESTSQHESTLHASRKSTSSRLHLISESELCEDLLCSRSSN